MTIPLRDLETVFLIIIPLFNLNVALQTIMEGYALGLSVIRTVMMCYHLLKQRHFLKALLIMFPLYPLQTKFPLASKLTIFKTTTFENRYMEKHINNIFVSGKRDEFVTQ